MNQLCSEKDCEKTIAVKKRQLCATHYRAWAGKNKPNGEKPCAVENCTQNHYAKTYCRKHYITWKEYGSPIKPPKTPEYCGTHPERLSYTRGMCRNCYQQWYYHNGPTGTGRAGGPRKDVVTYEGAHFRVRAAKGHARQYECAYQSDVCTGQAFAWALTHEAENTLTVPEGSRSAGSVYSLNPDDYVPMCDRCHRRYDSKDGPGPRKAHSKSGQGSRYEDYLKQKARNAC